jgi:hypothetical protein
MGGHLEEEPERQHHTVGVERSGLAVWGMSFGSRLRNTRTRVIRHSDASPLVQRRDGYEIP